ncbi:MAG: YtxH domain-containing protein [Aggregatilineales bacterium]
MVSTPSNNNRHADRLALEVNALVLGLICGALVGAVIGLFTTPRSGSQVRREITRTGQALVARIEETAAAQDAMAESMEAGKAAARRRRADLGLRRRE